MTSRFDRLKREIWNLPNMITIGRVLLIPPVLLLIDKSDPYLCVLSMLLFMLASALDLADGWLARRQGLVTVFGKFMDPLADKIMVTALLVYLVADARVPAWMVALLLTREFYISGLRLLAASDGVVIAASSGGKLKTAFQLVGICFLLVHYRYRLPFTDDSIDFNKIGLVLLFFSILASLSSAWSYTRDFGAAMRASRADSDPEDVDAGAPQDD
ncbi:MAG: CDP-diacylglycerol--glycerol-3-phosphate 3-phosphatidyltransferase [Nannocystaceae bacterium]|nr:CDP-diacylglycerol--glycerol-3-phosphate 3-phosphatidyltransferase [Myxococcales bacterium]